MSFSPNMGLALDTPLVTPGPDWAADIVSNFELVDTHDHTLTNGTAIPTAGLNINADLPINGFNLTAMRTLRMADQTITPILTGDLRILYVKNGELAYRDGSGNEVIMTSNGSVAGATGTITGLVSPASASYSTVTQSLTVNKDTAKPAKFNISEISIYEFDNATANPVTVKSPDSVANAYSYVLPDAPPVADDLMYIDSSGQVNPVGTKTLPGMIPLGAILPSFPNISGAYVCGATTVADAAGLVRCEGQTLADARSAMDGETIPDLTQDIFLLGNTASGATGGSNTIDLSHTHTAPLHNHGMAHVHAVMRTDSGFNIASNTSQSVASTVAGSDAVTGINNFTAGGPGLAHTSVGVARQYYSSGVSTGPNGTGSTAFTANDGAIPTTSSLSNATDIRPHYINVVYVMRVL